MADIIDASYFAELDKASPERLKKRNNCNYSPDKHRYRVELWGDQFHIDPTRKTIERTSHSASHLHPYFDLLAIYYLLGAKDILLTKNWVSEKDLPGGSTFFRGPHLIPTDLISRRFNNELQEFKTRCEHLGGTPIRMGDAAYSFAIAPDLQVAVLYWVGDEDFPAEAKMLFDSSIANLLTLDIIFALAVGVCSRIGSAV